MNCDQVFRVLTRGPFPTGDPSDVQVERHLARCGDCRQLAEALRPALELIQEAVSADESRDLPGYWSEPLDHGVGRPMPRALALAARVPAALHQRLDRGRNWIARRTGRNGLRFTVAILIGAVIGLLLRHSASLGDRTLRHASGPGARPDVDASIGPPASRPQRQLTAELMRRRRLELLQLPPACFGIDAGGTVPSGATGVDAARWMAQAEVTELQCCTQCHAWRRSPSVPDAVDKVKRSCSICHD